MRKACLMTLEALSGRRPTYTGARRAGFGVCPGRRHVPWMVVPSGWGTRGAECNAARRHPRVLEAGVEHLRRPVHGAVGQSAASEEGPGEEDGRERRGMDCAVVAAWFVAGQLRTASAPA